MPATKKTTSTATKKKASQKKTVKKVTKAEAIKSLQMAPSEKNAFMLISSDFDGENRKALQALSTIILLGILGTMVFLAVKANEIANLLLVYG